ncbi:uncharacterized protein [Littorina saxatilis]|uniref:uncharacterized protein n=1 Tax=Littorina saxatilis TaxID=31220 RepID=UPI0038B5E215
MPFSVMFYLVLVWSAVTVQGEMITCSAKPGQRGQPGNVTCNFPTVVSSWKPVIVTVERYAPNSQNAVEVLECQWLDELKCKPTSDGYSFDGVVTSELRLVITNTSEETEGRYVCKAMSEKNKADSQACYFLLYGKTTDPSTTTQDIQRKQETKTAGAKQDNLWILAVVAFAGVNLFGIYFFCFHEKCGRLFRTYCVRVRRADTKTLNISADEILEVSVTENKGSSTCREDHCVTENEPLISDARKDGSDKVTHDDEREVKERLGSETREGNTGNQEQYHDSQPVHVVPMREKTDREATERLVRETSEGNTGNQEQSLDSQPVVPMREQTDSLKAEAAPESPGSTGSHTISDAETDASDSDTGNDDKDEIRQRLIDHNVAFVMVGRVMKSDLRKCKQNLKKTGLLETLR